MRPILNFLIGLDIAINGLFGGERGETISARWGRSRTKVWLYYWGCRLLDLIQPRHCETAAEYFARIRAIEEEQNADRQ
jgi:hypothetical protein